MWREELLKEFGDSAYKEKVEKGWKGEWFEDKIIKFIEKTIKKEREKWAVELLDEPMTMTLSMVKVAAEDRMKREILSRIEEMAYEAEPYDIKVVNYEDLKNIIK